QLSLAIPKIQPILNGKRTRLITRENIYTDLHIFSLWSEVCRKYCRSWLKAKTRETPLSCLICSHYQHRCRCQQKSLRRRRNRKVTKVRSQNYLRLHLLGSGYKK